MLHNQLLAYAICMGGDITISRVMFVALSLLHYCTYKALAVTLSPSQIERRRRQLPICICIHINFVVVPLCRVLEFIVLHGDIACVQSLL